MQTNLPALKNAFGKLLVFILLISFFGVQVNAQSNTKQSFKVTTVLRSAIPDYVQFQKGEQPSFNNFENWLNYTYHLSSDFGLMQIGEERDQLGWTNYRYTQTFKGLPIYKTMLIVHVFNGEIGRAHV